MQPTETTGEEVTTLEPDQAGDLIRDQPEAVDVSLRGSQPRPSTGVPVNRRRSLQSDLAASEETQPRRAPL
jgi:hypothetical protein